MKRTLIALLVTLPAFGLAQNSPLEPSRWMADRLTAPFERSQGLSAAQVWKRPWHFVVLFNSAHASARSAYTDAAKASVLRFLADRAKDGGDSKVSFLPYQLDLYSSPDKSLQAQPLNADSIERVEKLWPSVPFPTLGDGKTPYPARGGHDNAAARLAAMRLLGPSSEERPTAVLQVTDTAVSESPGSPADGLVRDQDGRTGSLDGTGLTAFPVPGSPFTVGPGQRMNVWLYGPQQLAAPGTPVGLYVACALALVVLALAAWKALPLLSTAGGGGRRFAVQVPGNGSVVLGKGERLAVVGRGSTETGNVAVLSGDGIPPARLFEIEAQRGRLRALSGYATVEDAVGNVQPELSVGANDLILKHDGKIRKVRVEVSTQA